jgi:membrane protein YqaA with SNARE-associated domain
MDLIAHGLWAGLGIRWVSRKRAVSRPLAVLSLTASILPDLLHLVPVALWAAFSPEGLGNLMAYALASPGREPAMPPWVAVSSHHLHCVMHSAIIAGVAPLVLWARRQAVGLVLAGWWLHIVIDVLTHSSSYYPVPVLYPVTYAGFDGIAWNTPWFAAANYLSLLALWGWFYLTGKNSR